MIGQMAQSRDTIKDPLKAGTASMFTSERLESTPQQSGSAPCRPSPLGMQRSTVDLTGGQSHELSTLHLQKDKKVLETMIAGDTSSHGALETSRTRGRGMKGTTIRQQIRMLGMTSGTGTRHKKETACMQMTTIILSRVPRKTRT